MTKNILIAQIGKGAYKTTEYSKLEKIEGTQEYVPGKFHKTGYSFEAVMEEIGKSGKEVDTVILVGTETSFWGSLCHYYSNENNDETEKEKKDKLDIIRKEMPEISDALYGSGEGPYRGYGICGMEAEENVRNYVKKYLEKHFGQKIGRPVVIEPMVLKAGINENELQSNFTRLLQAIENLLGDSDKNAEINIYFDISNGYRSLPMYIFTFVNYLTRIRKEKFELFMYYGMADAMQKKDEKNLYAPLVDLQDVNDLMLWINAVNEFRNYGSVRQIEKIFKAHKEWDIQVGPGENDTLSNTFQMFDYATNAHNLKVLEETIGTICSLREKMEGKNNLPQQAQVLLADIADDFEKRFSRDNVKYKYSYLTLQLARWFYEQDRIGSAAVALQEGITTYIMERYPEESAMIIQQDDVKQNKEKFQNLLINEMPEKYKIAEMEKAFLFEYPKRKKISEIITDSAIKDKYSEIRIKIRNISAHILYEEASMEDVEGYKNNIHSLLNEMLDEIQDRNKKEPLFEMVIKRRVRRETSAEEMPILIKNLKKVSPKGEFITEDQLPVLRKLRKQILQMADYERKPNGFREFIQELDNMPELKFVMDRWIAFNKGSVNEESYRKRFGKDLRNPQKGYGSDRLLNYCSTNVHVIDDYIEMKGRETK